MLKMKTFFLSLSISIVFIAHSQAQTIEPTPPEGMPDKHKNIVQNIGRALSYQKACAISKIKEGYTAPLTRYMNNNRDGFEWDLINPGGKYNAYLNEYSRYETKRIMDEYVEYLNKRDAYAAPLSNYDKSWHGKMLSCYHAVADFGDEGASWANLMDISCTSFRAPYCTDAEKFDEWIKTQNYVCDEKSVLADLFANEKDKFSCHTIQENRCTLQRARGGGGMSSIGSGC